MTWALLAPLLAGCAPHVNLAVSPTILSDDWGGERTLPSVGINLDSSWAAFGSAALEKLIDEARRENADIAIAGARIDKARAAFGLARAADGPSLTAFGGVDGNTLAGRNISNAGQSYASIGLDVSYDLDLFGTNRANRRAARARLAASDYDRQAVKLIVEADVATGYVQIAALSDRIAVLQRFLKQSRELENVIRLRMNEGAASPIDLSLQVTEANAIEIKLSTLVEARENIRNALAVLTGREAPGFPMPMTSLNEFVIPVFVAAQPATLLSRRPDLRVNEFEVRAAEGDVANLRSAYLPKIQISAAGLIDSAGSGGLLQLGISAGASLLAPIFDNGMRRNNLFRATAEQHGAVESYRKAILQALAETQNALVAEQQSRKRGELYQQSQAEARRTATIVTIQFREGSVDFGTLLDAERRSLEVEEGALQARQERLLAAISLFRAMGGAPAVQSIF